MSNFTGCYLTHHPRPWSCLTQVYQNPNAGLCILHAQVEITDSKVSEVVLPPFLDVERKLGGSEDENKYGAYSLSIIGENR